MEKKLVQAVVATWSDDSEKAVAIGNLKAAIAEATLHNVSIDSALVILRSWEGALCTICSWSC